MNSLKNLFFIAVLAAAACGVYVSLNRSPEPSVPPGVCQNEPPGPAPPKVQMPGSAAPASSYGAIATGTGRPASATPGLPVFPSPTPSSASTPPRSPLPGGDMAMRNAPQSASVPGAADPRSPAAPPAVGGGASGDRLGKLTLPSDLLDRYSPTPPSGRDAARPTHGTGSPSSLDLLMKTVESNLDEGRLADAHLLLSSLYGNPKLPPDQAKQVTRLLDQMAATVIYSRQHLLERPYRVQPGDTLQRIAESYDVPPQLLARVNGIRDPQNLAPGRELKVVRGPFSALVDLGKSELTLMLQGRYAGRFPIGIGADPARLEGTYIVRDKRAAPSQETPGAAAAPQGPTGPREKLWIDLGNQVTIHGTADPRTAGQTGEGSPICLGNQDMDDVFGILSVGSRIMIQR